MAVGEAGRTAPAADSPLMDLGDYVAGSVALAVTVLPWAGAGRQIRRRVVPGWAGAAGVLVGAVVAISGLVVSVQLAGLATVVRRWPLAGVSAGLALLTWAAGRAGSGVVAVPPVRVEVPHRAAAHRLMLVLAGLSVAAVTALLLGRAAQVLHTGPTDVDAVHYHLTHAAELVQSHSLDHLFETAPSDASVFYPYDAELLDTVGMLGPRPDLAVLPVVVLTGWLALLACWVIGRRWSAAPAATVAGCVALGLPLIGGASAGPGLTDIPAAAFLLAAVAVTAGGVPANRTAPRLPAAVPVLSGLALGLAAGTKLPALAPTVLLALALCVLAPGRRVVTLAATVAAAVLTGGFWYVRDWVLVGSPLPSLNLTLAGHGLRAVPDPLVSPQAFTVAHYLGDLSVLRHAMVPQLRGVATELWPVVVLAPLVGIGLAVARRGDPLRRLLGVVTLLGVASYLVTPTSAAGPAGHPVLFGSNLRYVLPELMLGLVLLAVSVRPRDRGGLTVGLAVLVGYVVVRSLTGQPVAAAAGVAAALVVATMAGHVALAVRSGDRRLAAGLGVVGLVGVAVAGGVLQRGYLRDRYGRSAGPPFALAAAVQAAHPRRVAVAGFPVQYPYYGPRLDTVVRYVGVAGPRHSFALPATCRGWQAALAAGRYDVVVLQHRGAFRLTDLVAWTAALPGARRLAATPSGVAYQLPHPLTPAGCPG